MWEVWDVMLMKQVALLQAFEDLKLPQGTWPAGFAVFSSDAIQDDPMMTRLYLSPTATALTAGWPANSFTRSGFVEAIPVPYAVMLISPAGADPVVEQALAGIR
jgi:hypothetical protein